MYECMYIHATNIACMHVCTYMHACIYVCIYTGHEHLLLVGVHPQRHASLSLPAQCLMALELTRIHPRMTTARKLIINLPRDPLHHSVSTQCARVCTWHAWLQRRRTHRHNARTTV
jgi:hypothetical protein